MGFWPQAGVTALFHRDLGGPGNPPLVLLHGLLGSSRNWQTAGADLAAHFHVFALDLRNHGRSPHVDSMSHEELAADVIAWLDRQHLASVILVAHSLGGKTAMLLACRQAERVARLVVVDIAPRTYSWPGHRASFAAMNELDLRELRSRAEAEMRLEARVPSWPMRKFLTTNLVRATDGSWSWQINLPVLARSLSEMESNPLRPDDRYAGPARFIVGGKSNYVESEDWVTIRRHFPAAEIQVIPEAGHNPHMEARAAFVDAVLASPALPQGGATSDH